MLKRISMLLIFILIYSCQNEASNKQNEQKENGEANLEYSIDYYLDGEKIPEGRYKALDERYHNVISPKDPKKS